MPHSNSHLPALEGRTLLDELNHRIKNELASVINPATATAMATARTSRYWPHAAAAAYAYGRHPRLLQPRLLRRLHL